MDVSQSFKKVPDERLTDADFMSKYGSTVLRNYDLKDLNGEDEYLDDDEEMEDDDEYIAGAGFEDTEMASEEVETRKGLVAHLSEESV